MADEEQVKILKQGAEAWNMWRKENPSTKIDLRGANLRSFNLVEANFTAVNLSNADLRGAYLSRVNLLHANLLEADLAEADLAEANLAEAHLRYANLIEANLAKANLTNAKLIKAELNRANLQKADFYRANLSKANLSKAILYDTQFNETDLTGTNLFNVFLGRTLFSEVDLSKALGIEKIEHSAASIISTSTIKLSAGHIPEVFLRGCGFSDWEIESAKLYKPVLSNQEIIDINYKIFDLRANQAIQISPLFISYSHADTPFVEKLEPNLTKKGIRFWRDVHNMTSGRMEKQVDHAMRQNPTVLLILSENSTRSDWVEHEARLARELEKEIGRDVLCPIALDESWKSAKWPARLMEQIKEYNILDYSNWSDDKAFGQVFNKMLSGLDMFYKPDKESSK